MTLFSEAKLATAPLEVLVGEMAEHRHIDLVLAKALGVLGHAELFEPVRNLLRRGYAPGRDRPMTAR